MPDVDLSEFYRLARPKHKRHCAVDRALNALSDSDSVARLKAAIAAEDLGTSAIRKWCEARELSVSDPAIRTHREQRCSCFRD